MTANPEVIIIGAGASGLMCAARAGYRGRRVLVIDHGDSPGRKILMSGGGRCNFTNRNVDAEQYISSNPHFVKSALHRYGSRDFLDLVKAYGIAYEERSHGQLFCRNNASLILDMLLSECRKAGVRISLGTDVQKIETPDLKDGKEGRANRFRIITASKKITVRSLVIATGGVSIPGAGATPFGFQAAQQFGIHVISPKPGLVPFTLQPKDKNLLRPLSGISVDARVTCGSQSFCEKLLFTHRGLSGPVVLQTSSYWKPGDTVTIDLMPHGNLMSLFISAQTRRPKKHVRSILCEKLPKRLVDARLHGFIPDRPVAAVSRETLGKIAAAYHAWQLKPGGTEGYRTAEVTVGGVDCHDISSKTMEARKVPGLYFIGEVLDVAGWLGGYNLQWAWSSGFCAGLYV